MCSLKLCEQISTSNQGLLLFECGELVKYLDQTPNSRDLFTRQCLVARGENLKKRASFNTTDDTQRGREKLLLILFIERYNLIQVLL